MMFETIDIPVWTLWVAGTLAIVGLLDRILMPTVRWYLRRRLNKAVTLLNDRLQLKIQPFKLTRRRVMIDRLAYDPKVIQAILEYSQEEGVPYQVAEQMVYRYASEIVPSFSALGYFGFAIRAAKWLSKALYRVRLGYIDEKALEAIDPEAAVVFVMNHRSNMDYVLVTYLASSRSALSYAVGEWARVFPLKQFLRSMGAYFIRRKSRNTLYRRVLARYVQMATQGGVAQAIFPEGGLSRDGKLQAPKLGLLNYILSDFDPKTSRDVVFVPVGLNYDRVLEDRVLLSMDKGERASAMTKITGFFRFVYKHIALRLTGKFHRYGYASVSFGAPVSLAEFLADKEKLSEQARTKMLGQTLLQRVGAVIPILPVSLIARVLLAQQRYMTLEQITEAAAMDRDRLVAAGGYVHIPRDDFDYGVEVGLRMLTLRNLVSEKDGAFQVAGSEEAVVRYYANAIAHLDG